jgi:prophage maintenance system killer protein
MAITINLILGHHLMMLQDAPGKGGGDGILLEKILWYSNRKSTCFESAAQFSFRVINEKPFNSFNKRIAIVAIGDFLNESGFEFTASSLEALQFVNDIEAGLPFDKIEAFITENSKPL